VKTKGRSERLNTRSRRIDTLLESLRIRQNIVGKDKNRECGSSLEREVRAIE
jgi:tetrahydromethanopterin S-methyltransferase subunit F